MRHSLVLLALCFLAETLLVSAAFDSTPYTGGSKVLHPKYQIFWRVDGSALHLALDVDSTGWFGFGIGEPTSGSMPGGDFVTIEFDGNNVAQAVDRWSDRFGLPKVDCKQDWTLVKFERQSSGRAVAELRRQLNTSDVQDRPISMGDTRVLFAWGPDATPSYHENNRGLSTVSFIPAPVVLSPLPSDGVTTTLTFTDYLIPPQPTTYVCKSFELPADRDYHIVSIESVVLPATEHYVHHFLAYLCTYEFNNTRNYAYNYQTAGQCNTPIGSPTAGCSMMLYTWASGIGELRLPAAAGFRVSGATNYVVLEVHYNNPSLHSGVRDSSGIKVVYTPTLRQHDAATLILGDPTLNLPDLPPALDAEHREATCPSECTSSWPHDINVFGSLLHMHTYGRSMWTTHWRNGSRVADIANRVDFYAYHLQQSTPMNGIVRRGDQLNTHCIFRTKDATSPVEFGIATTDEMCMNFITYYPRLVSPTTGRIMTLCGYVSSNLTICGDAGPGGIIRVPNPKTVDPSQDQARNYGVLSSSCPALPGSTTPSSFVASSTSSIAPVLVHVILIVISFAALFL